MTLITSLSNEAQWVKQNRLVLLATLNPISSMSAIYILIGASLPIAIGFLIAFIRSARNGQFDDDYTPSIRMLMDDETPVQEPTNQSNHSL